CMQVLQTPHSF
nr:immunoglobulin light chain junction region [Macaca mulatta]MPN86697.1 immunoglobulin light chain junction region [Macaca mulatta]MPN86707.1 immunoglobulin light chain junction region [Macaca mulatta]MPN86708.1 immunoglobulin light chain junction region [Macaca mulatta]MPN86709.1 immunoglobulin light chain junction region [Macaca mulatta]